MATNPRIPPLAERRPHLVAGKAPVSSRAPAVAMRSVLAGAVAVALLAAVFYYASRAREHLRMETHTEGAVPADGEGLQAELQLSDVDMAQAPGNGRLDIYGRVLNKGNHQITRAVVQLTFKDAKGKTLSVIQKPIHGRMKKDIERYRMTSLSSRTRAASFKSS